MRVKKFVARTLPEALVQAKAELGPDAVILQTSEMTVGGLFGLFGRKMIQVMAAVDDQSLSGAVWTPPSGAGARRAQGGGDRQPVNPPVSPAAMQAPAEMAERPSASPPASASAAHSSQTGSTGATGSTGDMAGVQAEMTAMKAMIGRLMDRVEMSSGPQGLAPELRSLLEGLVRSGVEEDEAWSLVGRVRSRLDVERGSVSEARERAAQLMRVDLSDVRPISLEKKVVVLAGPTGVGKTTTLAKLAAHFVMEKRQRVGLMTADTYRIAAVEQLRTYSEILGLPLEVVYDPVDVQSALSRLASRDLILVDMAGRSPRNSLHMAELQAYMDALGPAEVYLVMSLTSGYRDAASIVDTYLPLHFDRFLFTKWDESVSPGLIYTLVRKYSRPLSYITTGQSVPDDIEEADAGKITQAILGD